jgi:L-threonylcarbamoyladenylate synthase
MVVIGTDLDLAARLLSEGNVIGIPTETVYGLAGNAYDEAAVTKIFVAKKRPFFDPLICHYASTAVLKTAFELNALETLLVDAFMPGPLTLLVDRSVYIPLLVTAGSELVAVRVPAHKLTQQLLAKVAFPLAAPSANLFGMLSPTLASHVAAQLGDVIPYILDGGPARVGLESTIVRVLDNQIQLYRQGGVTEEELKAAFPGISVTTATTKGKRITPGSMERHYAPKIRMVLERQLEEEELDLSKCILLCFSKEEADRNSTAFGKTVVLSEKGDMEEAAGALFRTLHELDNAQDVEHWVAVIARLVPEVGLGRAINERLRRGAAKE